MSSGNSPASGSNDFSRMPATAVQALYHAATGKTENLTKSLSKNFIIRKNDLEQLYFKITQQLDLYGTVADPTITVKVKFHNEESQQFSSWERFRLFDASKTEIISEILLKLEFIIKLPNIDPIQRYIISVELDSQLPLLAEDSEKNGALNFIRFFPNGFPSLTASIDFIDYLCAKNFLQVIEEWFNSLEESPKQKWRNILYQFPLPLPFLFGEIGNVSTALFIAVYAYLKGGHIGGTIQLIYLGSIAITVWTISCVLCRYIGYRFNSIIAKSYVPPSIVLTIGDERAFEKARKKSVKALPKSIMWAFAAISTLFLNILGSYLYAWLN